MECNRDEAERAKEIADKKFKMKDIAGAKKFALKAQTLYPANEGVSQMLATLDVYIAVESKANQEVNWYGILGATPRDDNETLKRKYRKLALMLHPDKNSFLGAEGAFKHVSEAWKFLSDQEKRAAYDRRQKTMYQKVSVSSSNTGFCSFAKKNNPPPSQKNKPPPTQKKNPQKTGVNDHHTTAPNSSEQAKSNTFWTVCRRCMLQYEYLRTYVNCNLLCPDCLQSFSAVETPKPGMSSSSWSIPSHNSTSGLFSNSKWTFSRTSSVAHVASVVQQAYEKVKKDRENAEATALREKKRKRTTTRTDCSLTKRKVMGETETGGTGGRKVTYYVTGEIGRNMGKLTCNQRESGSKNAEKEVAFAF